MIYLLTGDNTYEIEQQLNKLTASFSGEVERVDGAALDANGLADIMAGGTLFSATRLVVVRGLSENKLVWTQLGEQLARLSDDTTLVLLEPNLDKRTKVYKALIKTAKVIVADYWTDRDARAAEEWLGKIAQAAHLTLSRDHLHNMVQRAQIPGDKLGQLYIDQMQLVQATRALSVLEEVTDAAIAAVLPPAPGETVFQLLECAIKRDQHGVKAVLEQFHSDGDPFMAFAAVAKQWSHLAAVVLSGNHAAELSIHPYVLSKLRMQARDLSRAEIASITQLAAKLDARIKLSEVTPWEGFDRLILAITFR